MHGVPLLLLIVTFLLAAAAVIIGICCLCDSDKIIRRIDALTNIVKAQQQQQQQPTVREQKQNLAPACKRSSAIIPMAPPSKSARVINTVGYLVVNNSHISVQVGSVKVPKNTTKNVFGGDRVSMWIGNLIVDLEEYRIVKGVIISYDNTNKIITIETDTCWKFEVIHDIEDGIRAIPLDDDKWPRCLPPHHKGAHIVSGISHLLTPDNDRIGFRDGTIAGRVGNYKYSIVQHGLMRSKIFVDRIEANDANKQSI